MIDWVLSKTAGGRPVGKRATYSLLGALVLLVVMLVVSGTALATTFSTPVDADYGHISNSVYLSEDDFPSGAPAAVLAGSEDCGPALAATVLAKAAGGPLLLTSSTALSSGVKTELARLKAVKVYCVGLSATIATAVKAALPAAQVITLTGASTYHTAALVAAQVKTIKGATPARVLIVPGDTWGSSLAAAAVAAANGWPILLTPQTGTFSAYARDAITSLGVTSGVEVDTSVAPGISGFTVTKAIAGSTSPADDPGNRYSETLAVSEYAAAQGWVTWEHVGIGEEQGGSVAFSADFPDNITLVSRIARLKGAYVLTRSNALLPAVATALKTHGRLISTVDFMRPDYDRVSSSAWSFAAIRQVKALNSPRVTGLSRTSGTVAGGESVTISGTGFSSATSVRLGKTDLPAGSWRANSDTSITISAMPAAAQPGATEVYVSNYWNANPSSPSDVYFYTGGANLAAMAVVKEAVKYLGVPYVWAGASTSSFDCSGLTSYVYNKFTSLTGVTLPHKAAYQANYGTSVSKANLIPGDLVFFGTTSIGHVGIYVGNGLMINSPRSGDLVCIEDVYRTNLVSAKRLISPFTGLEQNSTLLGYAGTWTQGEPSPSASGGNFSYSNANGGSVTVNFTGIYLQLLTKVSPSYGLARVTVDGKDAGTLNLYSATTVWKKIVWNTGMLNAGPHTVTFSWTGTVGGSGGGTNIGVDAFQVIGSFTQAKAVGVPDRFQDTDRNIIWTGLWDHIATPSASGGSYAHVNEASAAATLTFKGTSVAWVATKAPACGKARVTLDGADQGLVDLYSANSGYMQTVWSASGLTDTNHTLSIAWTGEKNAAAGSTYITVDAFDIKGTLVAPAGLSRVEQTDTALGWTGAWQNSAQASASGAAHWQLGEAGSATVTFNGTYLAWLATGGSGMGRATVKLDDGVAHPVDLARASAMYQQGVWATGVLPDGRHTVVISWDPGNAAGKLISVDAFDLMGSLVAAPQGAPIISSISPAWASLAGGTSVTINGMNFTGTSAVTFGDVPATSITVDSPMKITVKAPAHAEGKVDVQVTAPGGTTANTAADDFTYQSAPPVVRYEQTDTRIVKFGTWTNFDKAAASGSSYGRAPTSDSSATIYFNGTRLDWIAMKGTTTGIAQVYLDGALKATVDLRATTAVYGVNVWSTGTITAGTHVVKIVRSGSSPASSYLTLDAVDIVGTICSPPKRYEETDTHIAKTGSWGSLSRTGASGGTYSRSSTASPAASATITFTGTRLDYIGMKGTTVGTVAVSLDGTRVATINLNASVASYNQIVWSSGTLAPGTHTVKLLLVPSGSLFLTLDAVEIWDGAIK
jgi:cell wall-associated NlpC family hydrolase